MHTSDSEIILLHIVLTFMLQDFIGCTRVISTYNECIKHCHFHVRNKK